LELLFTNLYKLGDQFWMANKTPVGLEGSPERREKALYHLYEFLWLKATLSQHYPNLEQHLSGLGEVVNQLLEASPYREIFKDCTQSIKAK
ncbi:hypothetical protein KY318_00300, partial [Candidatus Woesearchaeota archaeon]|nr:hypothetical protein [Candidatus Woesearchaeota archaeon]